MVVFADLLVRALPHDELHQICRRNAALRDSAIFGCIAHVALMYTSRQRRLPPRSEQWTQLGSIGALLVRLMRICVTPGASVATSSFLPSITQNCNAMQQSGVRSLAIPARASTYRGAAVPCEIQPARRVGNGVAVVHEPRVEGRGPHSRLEVVEQAVPLLPLLDDGRENWNEIRQCLQIRRT